MVAQGRMGVTACGAVLIAALLAGCGGGGAIKSTADDAEKRATIDAMYQDHREDFPGVQDISAEDLAALRETGEVVIVDVREPKEQAVSMIPGAITREEFEAHRADYLKKPVVVHCTIGYRSGVYAEELAKEGIVVKNLAGSILSWVHAGHPLVDKEGNETQCVHVYGKKWALLPEGYEAKW